MKNLLMAASLLVSATAYAQDVRVAPLFCDGAVLQRDQPLPVWGWAKPGTPIDVALGSETQKVQADGQGRWRVVFPARVSTAEPLKMTVRGAGREITVDNLLAGDVWLLGGGDEMAATLSDAAKSPDDPSTAVVRAFIGQRSDSAWPEENREGKWIEYSSKTKNDFPAIGYYFARQIQQATKVPIGLIEVNGKETTIETWIAPQAFANEPALAELKDTLAQALTSSIGVLRKTTLCKASTRKLCTMA